MKLKNILLIVAGVILAFLLIFPYVMWQRTIVQREGYRVERDDCRNAPVNVDTVYDTIYVITQGPHRPVPVRVITETKTDTVTKPCISWYDEPYVFPGGRFRWRAKVTGCMIDSIHFSDMVLQKEIITITKTVDTCLRKPPEYKPKNHLGMSAGFAGNTLSKFPLVDADLWWSIKDKWAPYAGVQYDTYHQQVYLKAGIRVFFR